MFLCIHSHLRSNRDGGLGPTYCFRGETRPVLHPGFESAQSIFSYHRLVFGWLHGYGKYKLLNPEKHSILFSEVETPRLPQLALRTGFLGKEQLFQNKNFALYVQTKLMLLAKDNLQHHLGYLHVNPDRFYVRQVGYALILL